MKHFLLLAGMMAWTLSAQITLDQNDMSSVGDNIPRKSDTMTVLTGPGGSGPNQTWNFTATSNHVVSEITSVVSVASTPNANQFGNSNMAMTNDNASYLYFNKSAQSFTTQGFSGDLLGSGIINAVFNPDLTLHQFPRTFGSSFNDSYVIDVIVPGAAINPLISQIRFKRSSMVHDTTDAWGQIITPQGTYDVLRIYTTDNYTDSIWALPIFPPTWSLVSTSSSATSSYSWVGKGGKLAIAEMSFDTLGAPKIFKWTELNGIGVGLEEANIDDLRISPNPCENKITVSVDAEQIGQAYYVTDFLGKQILEGAISKEQEPIKVDQLSPGNYTLRIGTKYCRFIRT
ncbi:MAG: T9SS type A sorting domain-containing protein [Sphingomonadales bacterium]|nr:T9SS type A sorting domain-containing protein [Sphingomonadales bacterium]